MYYLLVYSRSIKATLRHPETLHYCGGRIIMCNTSINNGNIHGAPTVGTHNNTPHSSNTNNAYTHTYNQVKKQHFCCRFGHPMPEILVTLLGSWFFITNAIRFKVRCFFDWHAGSLNARSRYNIAGRVHNVH